jgi:hypothetical protein
LGSLRLWKVIHHEKWQSSPTSLRGLRGKRPSGAHLISIIKSGPKDLHAREMHREMTPK